MLTACIDLSGLFPGLLVLLLVGLVLPYIASFATYRSLRYSDPLPWWLVGPALLSGAMTFKMLGAFQWDRHASAFTQIWWLAAVANLILLPLLLYQEGVKREWFRRLFVRRKKTKKGKNRPSPETTTERQIAFRIQP